MLKRNLFAIMLVVSGLVMVSNAFGQGNVRGPRPSKTNPEINRNEVIVKPMQAHVNEIMIDGMVVWGNDVTITGGPHNNNSQRSRTSKSPTQNKLGNFEIQGVKSPRDVASGQATGKVAKSKTKNLGDTATHEVGH